MDLDNLTNDKLIEIVNDKANNWHYVNYDIDESKVKCKYFPDMSYDYILNFTNSQKKSVPFRIKKNLSDYEHLKKVKLTFIVSDKGVTYGQIIDGLEYGTSHLHLITDSEEKVIIGGEINVDFIEKTLTYNLLSGTFSLNIFKDIRENESEVARDEYQDKIDNLLENVFNIGISEDKKLTILKSTNNETILPDNKPNIEELRNICKLSSLQFLNGPISSDLKKRCVKNSLTRVEDENTRDKYLKYKKDINNKEINYLKPELTCHPFIDQEPIDSKLKEFIYIRIGNIININEHNYMENSVKTLEIFKPVFWISSPISRALSTGYFYNILADINISYLSINDLWREQDKDFSLLIQSKGGNSTSVKSGENKKYKWCSFDSNGNTFPEKATENSTEGRRKKLEIFKKYYIDTIPDLPNNIIWLTGHGGQSTLFSKMICSRFSKVQDGAVININEDDFNHFKLGETRIINNNICYIITKPDDVEIIKNEIKTGKILLLTRHLKPDVSEYSRYWNVGDSNKLIFSNINIRNWPGRPNIPETIDLTNILQHVNDFEKPLTVSVAYGCANVDIEGLR